MDTTTVVNDDAADDRVEWEAPARDAQEVESLIRALTLAHGFNLLFAVSNRAANRDSGIDRVKHALIGRTVTQLAVPPNTVSLLQFLRGKLRTQMPDAIFLTGIENWLAASDEAAHSPFVITLNHTRNRFPKVVPCPLVIWCPEHLLRTIARGAPDFFSIRSGVYTVGGDRESPEAVGSAGERTALAGGGVHGSVVITGDQNTVYVGSSAWGEANLDRRRQRLEELLERLEQYHSLPLKQQDELLEAGLAREIGSLCRELGRYGDADQWLRRALEIRERVLGPNHIDTTASLDDFATLEFVRGDLAAAESIVRRSLAAHEAAQGPNHPATAGNLNNLATIYANQGNDTDAEPLYRRAISILDRAFGPDSPPTAAAFSNLASLYARQGNYADAETLLERAIAVRQKTLGPEDPDTAVSLNDLASIYLEQGKYAAAKPLRQRALAIFEKILGPEHPMTINARRAYLPFDNGT
jgi:tetratricopeptide (TPR) repeat protein